MTNHNPTISSSNATGSFSENANTTGSTALHTLTGTMNFSDSDRSDTHTVSASLKSKTLSNGSVIPAETLTNISNAMSASILTDSNGSGKLKWTFSEQDDDFDFLSKNQTLTLTYEIKLKDNHGGSTTKLVTITVTGTDDKPIIDFGTEATLTERAGLTLSLLQDTANIAVHFTDVDLTNTGHTAQVIDVSASGSTAGILPGSLGEAELMSFFDITSVVKASGSSNGTINTKFSAPDLAFDYLAEGETVDIVYTIKLNDNAGMTSIQTVTVTIVGTNDGPKFISGPDVEHLTEGENLSPAGDLTACGDLLFGDIDLSDGHTVSTSVMATRSGGGAVPLTNAELLAAFMADIDPDSTNHLLGEVDWTFALDNSDVAFLNSGETLTIKYTLTLTDDAGATTQQTVTITILGTNDPVVVTSGPESATLAEFADTTGSAVQNTTTPVPTDSIAFTDTDVGDTHTVAVTLDSATWSAGGAIPGATQTDLGSALLTTLNDSTGTGSGSVDWTFSIADQDLDFLAAGETLTATYNVAISDGPTSASQTVTITVEGANDAVVVTSGPGSGSVEEAPGQNGSPDPASPAPTGTLAFNDVDLSDAHSVQTIVSSIVYSGGPDVPPDTFNDLMTALQTALNDSTGTGSGSVDWTFLLPDRDLDFLAAGETLTVTYDVVVSDGITSSTQQVTITATGAADNLTVNPATGSILDTAAIDDGSVVAAGNVILDAGDNGGDLGVTLSVTDVNGDPGNVGSFVAGAYGSLIIFDDGTYFYLANANLDPLAVGDTATEVFTFTVTDSLNRSETTTLTLNVFGADDAAVITAADAFGSVTEDVGPIAISNGGFETGDFTDWVADGGTSVQFLALGDAFGNYSVVLGPSVGSLSQDIATVAGEHYMLSFVVSGDPNSDDNDSGTTDNSLFVTWDGTTVLARTDSYDGFTLYTFDVVATDTNSTLSFNYTDNGTGMILDQVLVASATAPATETADGSISFSDIETTDTHTATFVAAGGDYLGTFTLGPITEGGGSGSLDWHFTVDNADIQFLGQGESISQVYTVLIEGPGGATVGQNVTVVINGANDAPIAVDDTVITDVGANGIVRIPHWALVVNDTDPDANDALFANDILSSSGGDAFPSFDAYFEDDATPGGSFTYNINDGIAVSGPATATIVNNGAVTTLTGTGAADIIIGNNGGQTLLGNGGNDVLVGNSGSYTMTGGAGDDIFAFEQVPDGLHTITDFDNVSDHDMIAVSAIDFGSDLAVGMDMSAAFESSSDAEFISGSARFHYDTTAATLYYSGDGTTASAIVLAQLQAGVILNHNDLMIV